MTKFKNETIIITKEAYFFLKNENRRKAGCEPLNQERLEKWWMKVCKFRNNGASYEKYPIADNEIRIDKDSFSFRLDEMKSMLIANDFKFRQDGFVVEGCYM